MAHEALVSLNLIIESYLDFGYPYTHPHPNFRNAELIHEELWSLKSILELNHFEETEELNALKGEILEAIPKFRDLLEHHINNCLFFFSEYQSLDEFFKKCPLLFFDWVKDSKKVREEMRSFAETMKKIKEEYEAKLDLETSNKESPLADEDFGGNAKDMVGIYDEDLHQLIDKLTGQPSRRTIISVVGMAGIGKTTIVKALYNDPRISNSFDRRTFLRVGRNYHRKYILLDLLACLSPKYNKILEVEKSENRLKVQIQKCLFCRRYLIVLDDVCDIGFWKSIMWYLPNNNNRSIIIVTTRLSTLAIFCSNKNVHNIRFRNEEESWNLFCRKVFVEDSCPPGLEKVGKKIVKKCGGLPLGIISIANILSKIEKSLESWEK